MFPSELLTMGLTSLVTGYFKLKSQGIKDTRELLKIAILRGEKLDESRDKASERAGGFFRGLIVISLIAVMLFPTIAPAFIDNLSVSITYFEDNRKILGIFGDLSDKLKFIDLKEGSIVIMPSYRHMLASVLGYFFGSSAVSYK